ncbi:MAG: hypothetical protein ACE5LB_16385 [Acidiferrobacterales bacterium]
MTSPATRPWAKPTPCSVRRSTARSALLSHALWLGVITSATLLVFAILRALKAHKYADVSHIKIQGGVALPASLAVVLFIACITFAILLVRARRGKNGGANYSI